MFFSLYIWRIAVDGAVTLLSLISVTCFTPTLTHNLHHFKLVRLKCHELHTALK
jgi:hypothetical protein